MASQPITEEDLCWLVYNWTPDHASFPAWLAGSIRAHDIISQLLRDALRSTGTEYSKAVEAIAGGVFEDEEVPA